MISRASALFLLLVLPFAAFSSRSMAQTNPTSTSPPHSSELVVLVHGMGRTPISMLPMKLGLERAGYRVLNFGYSSYGPDVEEISRQLGRELGAELEEEPATRVHFVGHSLGNIVIRQLLGTGGVRAPLGRFAMLAPPNQGSASADRYARYLDWLMPPIAELRTDAGTAVEMPDVVGMPFAIIAGEWDGKVSAEEACLVGADASAIVPSGHTVIAARPRVIRMVRDYLAAGSFALDLPPLPACGPVAR